MKRSNLPPLLSMAMALQMIISPVVYAQTINPMSMLEQAGQMLQQNQRNIEGQQRAQANQQLVAELTRPGRDKYFNTDSLARIPGLMKYMAQNGLNPQTLTCPTLPTTLTEIRAEVCRIGITNDRGAAAQAQLSEMFSLYKTYGDVAKEYETFRSNSNAEGQPVGVGCMKNALQTLNGFFAYRINELEKLTTSLEALNNQFREASKVDLNAIEESTAVLDGGNSELTEEVRTRRPDLFDFAKRFDNPACKSIFAGDAVNNLGNGRPGGLNQISKTIKDEFAAKPAGSKFSGESYLGGHGSVVDDINKMADSAAQQFSLNFTTISSDPRGFGEFAAGIQGSVSSPNGLNSLLRGDFFTNVQINYSKQFEPIASNRSSLESELSAAGVNPQSALSVANNLNATNFESEVSLVQNQIRNGCLQRSFGGGEFWTNVKKNIKDPRGSRFANENEFNSIRERIEAIMTNSRTTPEAKISELRALEQSEGSRFVLDMQGSYQRTVLQDGKAVTSSVSASQRAPSNYFNDIVNTCDAQFSTNRLGSAMTGASAIAKLRELNQQYRTLATNQSNSIRNEIKKKLIECDSSNEANNQQAGSCTSERFNTSAAGFCANAAFTCAGNMNSCNTQAKNFVTQIKTERTARVNNYKALAQKNKADIVRIFDTALAEYMKDGEVMRGLFGAGFSAPEGIQREVAGDGKYIDKFRQVESQDGALLLEDPDKYVDMFKRNIVKLKESVQKQQQEILGSGGRGGVIAQHVDLTERNYKTAMDAAKSISDNCIAKHDDYLRQSEQQRAQQMADQQKRMNELGERRQQICGLFSRVQVDANGGCSSQIADAAAADPVSYGQIRNWCRETGHDSNQTGGNSNGGSLTADDVCALPANRSEGTDSSGFTGLKLQCFNLRTRFGCTDIIPATDSTPRRTVLIEGCLPGYKEQILATANYDRRNPEDGAESIPVPNAPAYCSAGNNSDRSVPDNSMEAFARGMGIQIPRVGAQ